jgi:hypothetical protein
MLPRCWRHPRTQLPAVGNAWWLLELLSMLRLWLLPRLLSMLRRHAAPLGSASSGRSSCWGRVRLHGVGMQSACRHARVDDAECWSHAGNSTAPQAGTSTPSSRWSYHTRCPEQCLAPAQHPGDPSQGLPPQLLAPAAAPPAPAAAAACSGQAPAPASAAGSSRSRCWRRTLQQRSGRQVSGQVGTKDPGRQQGQQTRWQP